MWKLGEIDVGKDVWNDHPTYLFFTDFYNEVSPQFDCNFFVCILRDSTDISEYYFFNIIFLMEWGCLTFKFEENTPPLRA